MANHENYYENLLKRYLEGQCDQEELIELMDFLNKDASNKLLLLELKKQYANPLNENVPIRPEQSDRISKALKQKISFFKRFLRINQVTGFFFLFSPFDPPYFLFLGYYI